MQHRICKYYNVELTPDEQATVTYIAGYLVRILIRKITHSNLSKKNSLLYLLFHLLQDPESSNDDLPVSLDISNWCKLIDRGGLYHCTNEFVNTLIEIEKVVKQEIQQIT